MFGDKARKKAEIKGVFNDGSLPDIRHVLLGTSTDTISEIITKDRVILGALKNNDNLKEYQKELIIGSLNRMVPLADMKGNSGRDVSIGFGLTSFFAVGSAAWASAADTFYNANEPLLAVPSALASSILLVASGGCALATKKVLDEHNDNKKQAVKMKAEMLSTLSV